MVWGDGAEPASNLDENPHSHRITYRVDGSAAEPISVSRDELEGRAPLPLESRLFSWASVLLC